MRVRNLPAVVLLLVPGAAIPAQNSVTQWQPVAELLVRQFGLTRGERVLLVGEAGKADSLVPYLRAAVVKAGGTDLGVVSVRGPWPAEWDTDFTQKLRIAGASDMPDLLDEVDLGVMLPGAVPTDPLYASLQEKLRSGEGRTVHFHWLGSYRLDGTAFDPTPAVDAWYQRVLLETDYAALAERQRAFEAAMRTGEVRVTTPAGTDLRFRIGDRPVTRQDGDASAARAAQARNLIDREIELPAGAIRVAPVEESVEGTIVFPAGDWGGVRVEGLRMTFVRGKVTAFDATTGRDGVERELAAGGAAARSFREFALGFNPLLAIRSDDAGPWIPYYGYGSGIVRLSLGDNTELGGAVGGGYVRWNFFTDATVTIGGKPWPTVP
ncbi:MAG: aminopeptidase [Cytophagaceae bacterium]|nr:aminopeptidase [Gemmatimonadaceae bacterium]